MSQNEMEAKPGLPERVGSNAGLGGTRTDADLCNKEFDLPASAQK